MAITKKDVEGVARLARLSLTEEEKDKYAAQLAAILGYIEKLNQLNTDHVPPTEHPIAMTNVWREDVNRRVGDATPEDLLAIAPEREGPYFKVKKVIE